jgi:hypothetical protein
MRVARRVAARNGIAVAIVTASLVAVTAHADPPRPDLVLPLVSALAVASTAAKVPRQVGTFGSGRPITSLIPSRIEFEDGYHIDAEDLENYIGIRQPVDIPDVNRIVSFDVLRRPGSGWIAAFAYDDESREPHRPASQILRFVIERRF